MQSVLNSPSSAAMLHFASGRDYMMRSEKRPDPIRRASEPGGKPPRRRKKRAGFFYMLLMTLLLLTLWPLGLLMLWRRKVRWGVLTKLLTSILTLAACIILIGFALTVNTGNARYTAVQDNINSFLDSAADTLLNTGDILSEYAVEMADDMENIADALWERGKVYLANGIDAGVELTQQAKTGVLQLVEKLQPAATPEAVESTPAAKPEDTSAVQDVSTPEASATDAQASSAPSDTSAPETNAPSDAPSTQANDAENTVLPSADAEESPATQAYATAAADVQSPTSTPKPQLIAPSASLKPAALATVYHSTDGKWYHSFNRCSGMTGGGAYTLEECAQTHKQCKACGAPDPALIGQNCLWMDARKICHTSDECSAFEGKYSLILRDEALEARLTGCEKCGGNEYLLPGTILETASVEEEQVQN